MIIIIDFGSQYNQLIARRVRESHVYCQIEPPTADMNYIKGLKPEGIILSGGPSSIYEKNSPKIDKEVFGLGIPILGICYGMHFMTEALNGTVIRAGKREYGFAQLGALGVWKNYKTNPALAIEKYKTALKAGYTKGIPEIYELAGVKFDFSEKYIQQLFDFLIKELEE